MLLWLLLYDNEKSCPFSQWKLHLLLVTLPLFKTVLFSTTLFWIAAMLPSNIHSISPHCFGMMSPCWCVPYTSWVVFCIHCTPICKSAVNIQQYAWKKRVLNISLLPWYTVLSKRYLRDEREGFIVIGKPSSTEQAVCMSQEHSY